MTLTTGWDDLVPVDDSLCRRWLHHWADTCEAFAAGGVVRRDDRLAVALARERNGLFDSVTPLAPPADWGALLDEVDALPGPLHLWSLWPTPDLSGRPGWELEGHPPLLVRPPAPAPAPDRAPTEVAGAASLAAWQDAACAGFPLPGRPVPDLADGRLRLFVDEGATASALFTAHGLSSLALAATVPTARRRGHWRRHALHRLAQAPGAWFAGVFSDDSRPGAEALGFVPLVRFTLWRRTR